MASAQRLFPALAVLLAVCVAAEAVSTPSLSDLMRARIGQQGGRVSTASVQDDYGYEQYGIETKELCLQESEMKTCGWVENCEDDGAAPDLTPECVTGQFWTSDFSCCQEQHYGYDSPSGLRHSQLWSSSASIGTCDWTVVYVDIRNLDNPAPPAVPTQPGSTDITTNIAKLGTAWATCYLGPDSDACGGPLCDRMVMSMQGTVYRASNAYSHWGASTTGTGACITVNGPIDVGGGDGRMAGPAVGARAPAVAGSLPGVKGPIGTPVHTASDASLQYNGGHYGNYDNYDGRNPRTVFGGPATIIMGIINGMAGQHKEKWDEGVFEYVPYFLPGAAAITTALDPAYPWVRDKTYKLTFYRGAKY